MRTSTGLLLACLLAVCQAKAFLKVPAFENGKEYVYDYHSRVATGISEEDVKHFSGFGIKSHLKVYTKNDHVYFQFDDIHLGRANVAVEELFEELPMEYHEPKEGPLKEVVDYLEKPFSAVYEDGVFKHFYSPEDNYVNLRKAIVGLFQTNFHPEEEHDPHMYSVYEDGIGGDCRTLYKVGHYPDDDETKPEEVLNVTKIRFYDDCKHRPHLFFSSMTGYKCDHCDEKDNLKPLTTLGRVEYQIKGDKQQFTFEKIHSTGAITFTPFTTHGQTVISVVNQTLELDHIADATTFQVSESELKKWEDLYFHFHLDENEDDKELTHAHYYDRVFHKEHSKTAVADFLPILAQLAKDFKEEGRESETIGKAIYHLTKFSYSDWEELFSKHVHPEEKATREELTIRHVLYEIIPYVGTNPSFKYLLYLYAHHHESDEQTVTEMLYKAPFYVKQPTPYLIDYFNDYLSKADVKELNDKWNVDLLSLGTLLYKACVNNTFTPHPAKSKTYADYEYCTAQIQKFIDEFEREIVKNPKIATVSLRALRNTRFPEAFKFLVKVVKNEKYPTLVRKIAIWGLDHFTDAHEEEIGFVLAPIFFNPTEDYVLRIYAFEVLMETRPSSQFFGSLISTLHNEENQKVASYVYSTLKSFANSSDPCHEEYYEHARHVLNFVKPPTDYDVFRHSTNRIFSVFNEKYNYGRSSQFSLIPSEHSVIPRELYMRQSFNLLGYNFDFLELGWVADEGSAIESFAHYLTPLGLRNHEGKEHDEDVKEVVEKLHLDKHRKHDEPRFEIYGKMFNQDVKFADNIDNLILKSNEIKFDGEKIVANKHQIAYHEVDFIIPNEMGFPVVLMLKIPVSWHLGGSAKVNMRTEEGNIQGLNVDSNLHFAVDFTVKAKMFVATPGKTKYGYALDTNGGIHFPIKGSFDYDCGTKKLAIKYVPSTSEPYDLFYYDTTPLAIFPDAENQYEPIKYSDEKVHREYNFGHDYFGVGLKFNFTYDYDWNDYGSYRTFFKSFFQKDTTYEDYWYLADKWYAGSRGFIDYAFLNPTAKPFHVHVEYDRSKTHPTTEFNAVSKYEHTKNFETEFGWEQCKFSWELTGKGPVERKWKADFHSSSHWPTGDFRKFVFHFERSPLPNYDTDKFEICYKSNVTYNNYMTVFTEKPEEVSVKYNGRLTLGKECDDSAKEIFFKVKAEVSDEQKHVDKNEIDYYKECKKDHEQHNYFTLACWKVMKDAGRVDKFTFDIEHKNIPTEFKGFMFRIYSWFRHTFYNNLEIDHFDGGKDEHHLKIVANFSYEHPVVDVKVERPDKTVYYKKVYVPAYFPKYEPFTITEDFDHRYLRKAFSFNWPMCFISGDYHVRNFDEFTYKMKPFGTCWHLVFGDCENHHFFVFYKKAEHGPEYSKALKVMVGNDILKVKPTADGKLEVYLNKEKKSLDGPSAFVFKVADFDHKVAVSKMGKGIYIKSKAYGIELYFDGVNGSVFSSNLYKGKTCGYCGNMDGEHRHEYEGPDGKHWKKYDDEHNFAVEKDGCTTWSA